MNLPSLPVATLDQFIAWLETQPADKEYSSGDNCNCALTQFAQSFDPLAYFTIITSRPETNGWFDKDYRQLGRIGFHSYNLVLNSPHTFGDLLARAKELRGEWDIEAEIDAADNFFLGNSE